ncbi:MAG TPA: DUF2652 domain-containing protein, partial [Candidatus Limnocylindria bacterium]
QCECNACRRMPQLDLKFVVHLGDVLRHRVAGREELAGRDVIVVHRLLKGTSVERAGASSYLLLTAATVEVLGLDSDALGMTAITEQYEDVGEVRGYLIDLARRWEGEQRSDARARPAGRLIGRLERLLPVPRPMAWEYLTAPGKRMRWEGMDRVDEELDGRRGVGTTTACVSGRLKLIEEILDWRPFDTFTRRLAHPDLGRVTAIHRLSEIATGTHLEVSWFASRRADGADWGLAQSRLVDGQSAALDRLVDILSSAGMPRQSMPAIGPVKTALR